MRRLLLALGAIGAPLLGLAGCASQGYGSGGGYADEYYDDCYDGYCMAYDSYGRVYQRPQEARPRMNVDPVDHAHGSTRTVDRSGIRPTSTSASAARMSVSRPSAPPPPPPTASRR
jgi:hypothetical protein